MPGMFGHVQDRSPGYADAKCFDEATVTTKGYASPVPPVAAWIGTGDQLEEIQELAVVGQLSGEPSRA